MGFAEIAALQQDSDFAGRTSACYAVETLAVADANDPPTWQAMHAWDMAAQPGFGDAYASAIAGHPGDPDYRPGLDPAAITDPMILGAVQSIIATETPVP